MNSPTPMAPANLPWSEQLRVAPAQPECRVLIAQLSSSTPVQWAAAWYLVCSTN